MDRLNHAFYQVNVNKNEILVKVYQIFLLFTVNRVLKSHDTNDPLVLVEFTLR